MAFFCYRLPHDRNTHFGPVEEVDHPGLLEFLSSHWYHKSAMRPEEWYVEYWEIKDPEKDYLYPPKPGSGVEIWGYDFKNGSRVVRVA
jgi:hypothetical protein